MLEIFIGLAFYIAIAGFVVYCICVVSARANERDEAMVAAYRAKQSDERQGEGVLAGGGD